MTERLAAAVLVNALIRRANEQGGFAAVIYKGDPISGAMLVQCLEKGKETGLFERQPDFDGGYTMMRCGPENPDDREAMSQYLARRRRSDPDLWLIELDVAQAQQFAAQMLC